MAILRQSHDGKGRLGKLVRLLASDKPGEVTAAVAAINRTLQSAGLDIHALAAVVDRAPLVPQQHDSSAATVQDDDLPWRATRRWCADREEFLSEREAEFISSLAHWRRPTERQLAWLQIIQANIRRRQAR